MVQLLAMAKSPEKKSDASLKETALNIRNFPQELMWKCRERALQKRITLRQFVIDALRNATNGGKD
jgi:hypothetical protein